MVHPSHSRSPGRTPARPAYAMGGWIMLLFVVLIGLLICQSILLYMNMPTTPPAASRGGPVFGHQDAYDSGVKAGAAFAKIFLWIAPVLIPLITLGIAWVVGWLVSLMFGKSDDAGNIGASLPFLGAIALFGYTTYLTAYDAKNPPTPPTAPATASNSPLGNPAASGPTQSPTTPAPYYTPPPTTPTASPTPVPSTTVRPSPPAVTSPRSTFESQPIIAEFQKPLDAAVADVVAKADKLLPSLAKGYPHEIRVVNERLTAIADLRTSAAALSRSLSSVADDLRTKLVAAGAPSFEAQSASFRWAHSTYNATPRQFGADALVRLCDKATEEAEYLRDNIAKWTVDSRGEIKSRDIPFQQKAGSNRFFVKSDADRREWIKGQLQGK